MLVATALAGLAMASTASAAMAITYPHEGVTWFTNASVRINFTAGPEDPQHWTVWLTNDDPELLAAPQQIMQQLNQTHGFVDHLLPGVREGDGYHVVFANETNATDVFAKSEAFRIEAGKLPNNTSTTQALTSTSSSVNIPGVTKTSTSSANPFASESASADKNHSGAGSIVPATVGAAAVAAAVFALL